MSRIWIFLWIFLLVIQMLTVWINRQLFDPATPVNYNLHPELIELARITNECWPEQVPAASGLAAAVPASRSELLIKRESLLLELENLQIELKSSGTRLDIVRELEASFKAMDAQNKIPEINVYIASITNWIRSFTNNSGEFSLARLSLFPATKSSMPELVFEMNGNPVAMGKSLLSPLLSDGNWRLIEIDMLMPKRDSSCWVRGSCEFLDQSGS